MCCWFSDPLANGVDLCCGEASARSDAVERQDCADRTGKEEAEGREGGAVMAAGSYSTVASNLRKPHRWFWRLLLMSVISLKSTSFSFLYRLIPPQTHMIPWLTGWYFTKSSEQGLGDSPLPACRGEIKPCGFPVGSKHQYDSEGGGVSAGFPCFALS